MRVLLLLLGLVSTLAGASERIVSLAPHLTEWVYSLGQEQDLVAVSAYSNFPEAAQSLPRVADYRGADLSAIAALSPTLILAWEGGNRPQDIARLKSLGYEVFSSTITQPEEIASELTRLAGRLDAAAKGARLAEQFRQQLDELHARYQRTAPVGVFYYSWQAPLMSIGPHAWPNKLLNMCGATTIFSDAPSDYPQVSLQQVIRRQPAVLIAASKDDIQQHQHFWAPHRSILSAPLLRVNPDITSRFTLRLTGELSTLCKKLAPYTQQADRPPRKQ